RIRARMGGGAKARVARGGCSGKSYRHVVVEAAEGGCESALEDLPARRSGGRGSGGRGRRAARSRRGRRRPGARAISSTGVERAVGAQHGAAGATILALARRPDDRRLLLIVLVQLAAHRPVRLAADRSALALHDQLATWLLRNERREVRGLERALDALLVLAMRLTAARAAAAALDPLPRRFDGSRIGAFRVDACREGRSRKGGEHQCGEDAAIHVPHGSLLARIHRLASLRCLGSNG